MCYSYQAAAIWGSVLLSCLHVFKYTACSTRGSQKRVVDPLGLKLQTIVNCHVGAED